MKAKAYLMAFYNPARDGPEFRERPIVLPDEGFPPLGSDRFVDDVFESAYCFGQNDRQPIPECYSVSVRDVVEVRIDGVPVRRAVETYGFGPPLGNYAFEEHARTMKEHGERRAERS